MNKSVSVFIFIIAFSLRLLFIFEYSAPLIADEIDYDRLAVSIMNGKGYVNEISHPTATRPPAYPVFLSIIYFFTGRDFFIVRLIQAIIDSLLCVLIYYIGNKFFGETVGILSAFLAAIHLGFIAQSAKMLTEGLTTFLLLISMLFFYKARENPCKNIYYFLAGFVMGITSLTRSNFLILFIFLGFFLIYDLWKKGFGLKGVMKYITVYTVAFLIPILPWTVRNYNVFHAFVPISTFQGIAFYASYKPINGKIYGFTPKNDITKKAYSLPSEVEQSNFLTKETFKLLKGNPGIFFKLIGLKLAYLFSPFDWELIHDRVVYNYLFAFYFPFFIIGSLILLHRFNELTPFYLPVITILITAVFFFGIPRFRVPIEPYMILFSSSAIISIYESILYKRLYIFFLFFLFLVNILFYANSSLVKQVSKMFLGNIGIW